MGVHGLTSYLDRRNFGVSINLNDAEIPHSRTLVVDGCGLIYHLYVNQHCDRWCGGQPWVLAKAMAEFLSQLLALRSVRRVIVVLDGTKEPSKDITRHSRRDARQQLFAQLMKIAGDDPNQFAVEISDQAASQCLPPMSLLIDAVISELAILPEYNERLTLLTALDENDAQIAGLAHSLHAYAILAQDSDFLVYNLQCYYIPYRNLVFVDAQNVHATAYSLPDTLSILMGQACPVVFKHRVQCPSPVNCSTSSANPTPSSRPNTTLSDLFNQLHLVNRIALFACLVGNDRTRESGWLNAFHQRLQSHITFSVYFTPNRKAHSVNSHDVITAIAALLGSDMIQSPVHFQRILFGSKLSDSRMTELLLELLAAVELYDVVAINAEPSALANIYSTSMMDCHAASVPLDIPFLSLCNAAPVICYPTLVAYNGVVIPECLVEQFYRAQVDPDVMNLILRGTYWSVIRLPDSAVSHKKSGRLVSSHSPCTWDETLLTSLRNALWACVTSPVSALPMWAVTSSMCSGTGKKKPRKLRQKRGVKSDAIFSVDNFPTDIPILKSANAMSSNSVYNDVTLAVYKSNVFTEHVRVLNRETQFVVFSEVSRPITEFSNMVAEVWMAVQQDIRNDVTTAVIDYNGESPRHDAALYERCWRGELNQSQRLETFCHLCCISSSSLTCLPLEQYLFGAALLVCIQLAKKTIYYLPSGIRAFVSHYSLLNTYPPDSELLTDRVNDSDDPEYASPIHALGHLFIAILEHLMALNTLLNRPLLCNTQPGRSAHTDYPRQIYFDGPLFHWCYLQPPLHMVSAVQFASLNLLIEDALRNT